MLQADSDGTPQARRRHRALADAPSLQALTHPTRLALMEAIALSGSLTSTQASRFVGESPTACAYHLRTLARLGFIEEAGGGTGRERPWRLAQTGMSISEDSDDPATAEAAKALNTVVTERFISRIRAFELARSRVPDDVRSVTGAVQSLVFATPAEVRYLRREIEALLSRYGAERMDADQRPPGSTAFEFVTFIHVFEPGIQGGGGTPPGPGMQGGAGAQAAQDS